MATVHDFLVQGRGVIDESNAALCAALAHDGYINIVKAQDGDEALWVWELTEDGKHMAALEGTEGDE